MSGTMMACGHSAQAVDGTGAPVCAVCFGVPEARQVAAAPDLTGRKARCTYARGNHVGRSGGVAQPQPVESSTSLAFFKHQPGQPEDSYYCGCLGWD